MKKLKCVFNIIIYALLSIIIIDDDYSGIDLTGVLTFLSIGIGFSITALSFFGTSKLSHELYNMLDRKTGKTLLHSLFSEFRLFLYTSSIAIALSLLVQFKIVQSINSVVVGLIYSLILYLSLVGVLMFIRTFLVFCKYIIKSVSKIA